MKILWLVGATVVVVGLLLFAMTRGGDDGDGTALQTPAATGEATAGPEATAPAGADLPTPPPGAEFFSRITDITVEGDSYAVAFETFGFDPMLQGSNKHLHFFFDTVPRSQAGVPGSGDWKIHPTQNGVVGESPFTGYGVGEVPQGAQQLCVLVANSDHSVIHDTGTCMDLP